MNLWDFILEKSFVNEIIKFVPVCALPVCVRLPVAPTTQTGKIGFGVRLRRELSRTAKEFSNRSRLAAFSHSTFNVGRSMFDVHLGPGLSGLGFRLWFIRCSLLNFKFDKNGSLLILK